MLNNIANKQPETYDECTKKLSEIEKLIENMALTEPRKPIEQVILNLNRPAKNEQLYKILNQLHKVTNNLPKFELQPEQYEMIRDKATKALELIISLAEYKDILCLVEITDILIRLTAKDMRQGGNVPIWDDKSMQEVIHNTQKLWAYAVVTNAIGDNQGIFWETKLLGGVEKKLAAIVEHVFKGVHVFENRDFDNYILKFACEIWSFNAKQPEIVSARTMPMLLELLGAIKLYSPKHDSDLSFFVLAACDIIAKEVLDSKTNLVCAFRIVTMIMETAINKSNSKDIATIETTMLAVTWLIQTMEEYDQTREEYKDQLFAQEYSALGALAMLSATLMSIGLKNQDYNLKIINWVFERLEWIREKIENHSIIKANQYLILPSLVSAYAAIASRATKKDSALLEQIVMILKDNIGKAEPNDTSILNAVIDACKVIVKKVEVLDENQSIGLISVITQILEDATKKMEFTPDNLTAVTAAFKAVAEQTKHNFDIQQKIITVLESILPHMIDKKLYFGWKSKGIKYDQALEFTVTALGAISSTTDDQGQLDRICKLLNNLACEKGTTSVKISIHKALQNIIKNTKVTTEMLRLISSNGNLSKIPLMFGSLNIRKEADSHEKRWLKNTSKNDSASAPTLDF